MSLNKIGNFNIKSVSVVSCRFGIASKSRFIEVSTSSFAVLKREFGKQRNLQWIGRFVDKTYIRIQNFPS